MIDSRLEFTQALQVEFDAAVGRPQSLVMDWPNAPFTEPAADAAWCRFTIAWGETAQQEFGTATRRFRHTGVLFVSLFMPLNVGERDSIGIAQAVENHYRATTIAGATFRTPTIQTGRRDGPRWLTVVQCPFYADQEA